MRPAREPIHVLAVGLDLDEIADATVETADDLLGTLARLADGGIDVVLLSPELPDADGDDAVRSIRERAPDVPVIAVADAGWEHRALEAGAADVLPSDGGKELVDRAVRYAVALHRTRAELRQREIVDEDTGLYNARGFEQFASHHISLADRSRQPLVLLSIRIDGLEGRDDTVDPLERSRSLAETADVLRTAVRDCDVVARTGETSFCALLTGDAAGAETLVLARVVDALAVRNARSRADGRLALSIGAATYEPDRPVALTELIADAERVDDEADR